MGSRGMPRWIRNNPDTMERNRKCYGALLDELVQCANRLTLGCATCPDGLFCLVNKDSQAGAGGDFFS